MQSAEAFQQQVLQWFDRCGRKDLPWQQDISPYRVWVSEIMLQQTQVKTVIPYFERFTARFPDIRALAQAGEDEVLHLWTGLGYYARARNLLRCASAISRHHAGEFPDDIAALVSLPGIGRSTAGAIRSIAFRRPAAILDGNVKRILARYAAVPGWPGAPAVQRRLWALAEALKAQARPAQYSQALMDLGATVCRRAAPLCGRCPLQAQCRAFAAGRTAAYPGRKPRKILPVKATCMLLISNADGEVLLLRRPSNGLWGGLWSLPEVARPQDAADYCLHQLGTAPGTQVGWPLLRHSFSHYHLRIEPIHLQLSATPSALRTGAAMLWYKPQQPVPVGMAAPVCKLLNLMEERR